MEAVISLSPTSINSNSNNNTCYKPTNSSNNVSFVKLNKDVNKNNETFTKDIMLQRLQNEAKELRRNEPVLSLLLHQTVLHPEATSFERAVAIAITHRLSSSTADVSPDTLKDIFISALSDDNWEEAGHRPSTALREDALAYVQRDPACDTLLEPILFFKGYAAVVCHRVAYRKWHQDLQEKKRKSFMALWIQSQASAAFGVDIHPAATIGCGFMLDHATGVVVGETATIGDGCTILHGVTLGGTGKGNGHDRHPKVGKNVLIGAGTQVLGNIKVGDGSKIGAGSVVLCAVPPGATAVGTPARIFGGTAKQKCPKISVAREGFFEASLKDKSAEQEEKENRRQSMENLKALLGSILNIEGDKGFTERLTLQSEPDRTAAVNVPARIDSFAKEKYLRNSWIRA